MSSRRTPVVQTNTTTIRFKEPVRGDELAAMVQSVCGKHFFLREDGELFKMGLFALHPGPSIIATHSDGQQLFSFRGMYDAIRFEHCYWSFRRGVELPKRVVANAIRTFGRRFKKLYYTAQSDGRKLYVTLAKPPTHLHAAYARPSKEQ